MKKHILTFIGMLISAGISSAALAETSSAPSVTPAKQPCADLTKSCQSAGYSLNGPAGKDVLIDCIVPTLGGKKITHADANQIAACKADTNNLPCAKIGNDCKAAGYTGGPKKLTLFDCIIPLTQGSTVPGVNPSQDELNVCKTLIDNQIAQQPCLRVMIACKAAGYSPDNENGQLFARNCYLPLLNGQQVIGASVDAATAYACKTMTNQSGTLTQ